MPPVYFFEKSYSILPFSRETWNNDTHTPLRPQGLVWFTDGSLTVRGAGSGVFGESPRVKLSFPLGSYSSVFQAEVFAILACCQENLRRAYCDRHIYICSDSQAALKALDNIRVDSKLVFECRQTLDMLAKRNCVKLVWVPGHQGILGNEEADSLAREGSDREFYGPEPALGLSRSAVNQVIRDWMTREHQMYWTTLQGLRQSKLFIQGPSSKRAKYLLSLERRKLSICVGLFTGHLLRKHLKTIGVVNDDLCRRCGLVAETTEHVLCECVALTASRIRHLQALFLEPKDIQGISCSRLASFIEAAGLC